MPFAPDDFLAAADDGAGTAAMLNAATRGRAANAASVLDIQIALASIAAPTGGESQRADAVQQQFAMSAPLAVRRDDAGNVIARLSPLSTDCDEAPIAVLAHLDTVFAESALPPARREGRRVYLPGIGDNGRGLAAMLAFAHRLCHESLRVALRRPIDFIATVGEEGAGNLRGAKHYFANAAKHHATPHAAIALDGVGDSHVVHHGIASQRLRFSFHGNGGHPWTDRHAANAIHALGRALASIARCADDARSNARITVTRVGGGESLTSVPAHAWFEVDVRAQIATDIPRLVARVRSLVDRAVIDTSRADSPLRAAEELIGDRPGGALDAAHPLVALAFDVTRRSHIEPQSASASTDANVALSLGIPGIAIGAGGSGGGAHSAGEWYEDTNGARGLERALRIIFGAATTRAAQ